MQEASSEDRYRDLSEVIGEVLDGGEIPEGKLSRFEVTLLASGEATWRVWAVGATDFEGGYIPPPVPPDER